jgi:hypothetical protein
MRILLVASAYNGLCQRAHEVRTCVLRLFERRGWLTSESAAER